MGFALLFSLLSGGCYSIPFTSNAQPPPAEPDILERDIYVIGVADKLRITVWKNPELSVAEVPVRPDGKISVPLLNDVQAAGLTPEELKELITRALAEFVQNPDVTVVVTDILSKRVNVIGEVARSGPVTLAQDMRVLDAITAAGGFGPFADKNDVKVLRRSEGGETVEYHFNYGRFLSGRAPQTNMLLRPGDTVVVPD